jgi:hypothetical protein
MSVGPMWSRCKRASGSTLLLLSHALLASAFSRSRMPPTLLLPSLSCYGVGERPNAATLAWPQHERATTWSPERPSTQWRSGADDPSHGWTSAVGPVSVAPRRTWLPLSVVRALPPCHVAQPLSPAHSLQTSSGHCLWWTPHVNELPFSQEARRCCVTLKAHVVSVCFKCFRSFKGIFQMLRIDIAKVDWEFCNAASVSDEC